MRHAHLTPRTLSLFAVLLGAGCDAPVAGRAEPDRVQTLAETSPEAVPGTCWGKRVTPAVVETVSDQVLVPPSQAQVDGAGATPGNYRMETQQAIVQERNVTWFETPCPADRIPDFVSSLQRALAARNLYRGSVSGEMDARTRAAIREFQKTDGLDSDILSIASARKLGLVAVELPKD